MSLIALIWISFAPHAVSENPPNIVHPTPGIDIPIDNKVKIRLEAKIQNYTNSGPFKRDADIYSPKSVNIHPSGTKFYVNSLEGAKTVVYSLPSLEKQAVISHNLNARHSRLWAPVSGLFKFRHYTENLNTFTGKPVESTFSHNGRYLWVPYYRRSYDINAQDPSALAVIDTSADTIIRIMEAGVLPKMIATSPDGTLIAVTHWGDNTVGLIDISSENPAKWKYKSNIPVGKQLFHNFSLRTSVDRDSNTGEALRGTVFTPDGRYLLVGCMGGGGGIAIIDVVREKFLGKLTGVMPNVRHLVIKGDWLYASINAAGYVQRVPLAIVLDAIDKLDYGKNIPISCWQNVKTAPGARTIVLSPRGDYIFASCNFASTLTVVDSTMHKLADIPVDSYPVGLDISPDGKWLISTSQGRNSLGGNCVDVFRLSGIQPPDEVFNHSDEETTLRDESFTSTLSVGLSSITGSRIQYASNYAFADIILLTAILIFARKLRQR